jgi:uncharacterized membrane-anchored protein YhcB (DUF1043 family)
MEERDYYSVMQHLLRAAMELAPNGSVQRAFSAAAQTTQTSREKCIGVLQGMLDGMLYGNWPYVK